MREENSLHFMFILNQLMAPTVSAIVNYHQEVK